MSTEVMKQALEALETCRIRSVSEWSVEDVTPKNITEAIQALRTAIQQTEAKTDVRCEGCGYMTHHREHMGCVRAAKQFTHPAPGVPDGVARDAERYRWLRKSLPAGQGSLTVLLDDRCNGAFHKAVFMESLDASIDAAMLAASQAQKVKV